MKKMLLKLLLDYGGNKLFKIVHFGESTVLTEGICDLYKVDAVFPQREMFSNGEVLYSLTGKTLFQQNVVVMCNGSNKDTNNYVMELLILLNLIKGDNPSSINLVLPLMPYGRQDRKFGLHQPTSLRLFAQVLETVGVNSIITLDLHSPQSESVFRFPVYNLTAIPFLTESLINDYNLDDFIFCVPDTGSVRRGLNLARFYNKDVSIFLKQRMSQDEVSISNLSHDVVGRDVILLDDLLDRGITLGKCITHLKKEGANRVFVVVTHNLMTDYSAFDDLEYDAFYTTNSIEQNREIRNGQTIGIEKVIYNALKSKLYDSKMPTEYMEDSWFLSKENYK